MASLKQMIEQAAAAKTKAQREGTEVLLPVVSPLYAQWMERSEADQSFSPAALKRGFEVLSNQHKVKRTERFSASGLGQCPRRQIFNFVGMPQEQPSMDGLNIMKSGTSAHFWIMMEGITAGWLAEGEVFYRDDHYQLGGTLDGLLFDGSIWEYKSVAGSVYSRVTTNKHKQFADVTDKEIGPKFEHKLQLAGYEYLTGVSLKSLFYQHRDFGSFYEYRLGHDAADTKHLIDLLERLNGHLADNTLPPMYDTCESRTGYVYNECPYRSTCPSKKVIW
jgi:hypothetical protein